MPSIEVINKEDWLFTTKIGNHTVDIDVPVEMGGKDRAMTPPQLFLASVASCSAAFVKAYCKNAGIDTKDLKVNLDFEKFENPLRLGNLKIRISLPNVLEEKKKAVIKAAEHCVIHETMNMYDGCKVLLE